MSAQVRGIFPVQNETETFTGMETILYYRKRRETISDLDLIDIIDKALMENWDFDFYQGLGDGDPLSLEITNIGNVFVKHNVKFKFDGSL